MTSAIAENIKRIRGQIEDAAVRAGRDPNEILLCAATKTQSAECVREAVQAGVDACGENRVQELTVKLSENAYFGVPVHLIGHLQTNKIKNVVGAVDLIESVDSAELAQLISRRAEAIGITQDILVEINIADEPQKSGISPDASSEVIAQISEISGVKLCGIMCIAPVNAERKENMGYFCKMHKIMLDNANKIVYNGLCNPIMSMGMSRDYKEAIECGSTLIRLGTAIFGART
ncbi:MAG: YggS family pyridoxal phosphate-dependent enzyme [Oscillospiraceae bacterium]|jgi:pyridoxal phosphate enzyme (YggS family)|nr:YggS family pyridoxal phosphate-dependent enzyme [Oscillospiraceae bacterium]